MRIVFVGAGKLAVMTAGSLIKHGHEVVIIEKDKQMVEDLSAKMDCGFLNGDGSKPGVLREANPEHTDFLFCLAGDDQVNIIASLVGRSLGYQRVVTKIEDPELEHICTELGLENMIVPTRTVSRYLEDMVSGIDILELSTMIKGDARFFSFVAGEKDEALLSDLGLPEGSRVICYYRDGEFVLAEPDGRLKEGDEAIVLTRSGNLQALRERWAPKAQAANTKKGNA